MIATKLPDSSNTPPPLSPNLKVLLALTTTLSSIGYKPLTKPEVALARGEKPANPTE